MEVLYDTFVLPTLIINSQTHRVKKRKEKSKGIVGSEPQKKIRIQNEWVF